MNGLDHNKQARERFYNEQFAESLMLEQHELNRELLKEQHKFNLEIHSKQSKLVRFSIGATILAALLGAGLGAYLTTKPQSPHQLAQPIKYEPMSQQYIAEKTLAHQKVLNESLAPKAPSSTSASNPNQTLNQTTISGSDSDKVRVNKQ